MQISNKIANAFTGVVHNSSGALVVGGASSDNHLGGHREGVDYEVPKNIKTLHHLALQYVNQVNQCADITPNETPYSMHCFR